MHNASLLNYVKSLPKLPTVYYKDNLPIIMEWKESSVYIVIESSKAYHKGEKFTSVKSKASSVRVATEKTTASKASNAKKIA